MDTEDPLYFGTTVAPHADRSLVFARVVGSIASSVDSVGERYEDDLSVTETSRDGTDVRPEKRSPEDEHASGKLGSIRDSV